jgi:hypothetical protein
MVLPCTPDVMNDRMAGSPVHRVRVQKAKLASRKAEALKFPGAAFA